MRTLTLILILIFASCKKEETTKQETKTQKVFSFNGSSISYSNVKVNGTTKVPPVTVTFGDQVSVHFATQPTTPMNYDMRVNCYLDGILVGTCGGCNEYKNTFYID